MMQLFYYLLGAGAMAVAYYVLGKIGRSAWDRSNEKRL